MPHAMEEAGTGLKISLKTLKYAGYSSDMENFEFKFCTFFLISEKNISFISSSKTTKESNGKTLIMTIIN